MNIQQIRNLYTYTAIMLIDNYIISSSPDYLKEKSLKFFGKLGKDEFINFPKVKYQNQVSKIFYPDINEDFWKKYTETWCVGQDDYELMNIINFLLSVPAIYVDKIKNIHVKMFLKYIGNLDIISNRDLSYLAHAKINEFLDENINYNNRFFKLLYLDEIKE